MASMFFLSVAQRDLGTSMQVSGLEPRFPWLQCKCVTTKAKALTSHKPELCYRVISVSISKFNVSCIVLDSLMGWAHLASILFRFQSFRSFVDSIPILNPLFPIFLYLCLSPISLLARRLKSPEIKFINECNLNEPIDTKNCQN